MTKVGRIIYEETVAAVNTAVDNKSRDIAMNFIADGTSLDVVSRNTGLDMSVVQDLARQVSEQKSESTVVTV